MHDFKSPYRRIWSPVLMFLVLMGLYISPKTVFQPRPVKAAATPVFINEIHYDNTGTDTAEAVEVAGPAGTNLAGWRLIPYNGSGGASYSPIITLSGTIPNQSNGYGTLNFAISGLQNGAPDGVALVNASNVVIQFLSYEGTFTATNEAANGLTSVNIGVSEAGTEPVGQSLQLIGTGTDYENFTWSGPITSTPGAINTGQSFCGCTQTPVFINEIHYDNTGTDTA
ncbi:MAG TPA: hypothetical protein PLB32_21130, partial [Acidobacteriota bacterium]|nr:hypothetical protein [Acidobacteriota bacterium]